MAQLARRGPFGEPDFGYEVGPDPERFPVHLPGEGRALAPALIERFTKRAQEFLVEPRPDLSGIAQRTILVIAHQQRAEPRALTFRLGKSANHELLPVGAFELQPFAGAAMNIRCFGILGDDTFPALRASLLEIRLACLVAV